jgi:elongation factor P--beta-lysine ligase
MLSELNGVTSTSNGITFTGAADRCNAFFNDNSGLNIEAAALAKSKVLAIDLTNKFNATYRTPQTSVKTFKYMGDGNLFYSFKKLTALSANSQIPVSDVFSDV